MDESASQQEDIDSSTEMGGEDVQRQLPVLIGAPRRGRLSFHKHLMESDVK